MEEDAGTSSTILVTVAGGNFVQLGSRFLIGAVVPLLLVHFETTRATIGLALTGMWAVYALTQFPSGMLADRYSERVVVLVALVATCCGVIFVALSPTIALFSIAALILGVGSGLFFAPAATLVTRLYAKRGQALSALTASGALAGLVFPAVGGVVGARNGWRIAVSLSAVATSVVIVATVLSVPSMTPTNSDRDLRSLLDFHRHWSFITRPDVAYSLALGSIGAFTFQGISSFFPTFLIEFRGLGTEFAGVAFGLMFGISAVAQPIAGRLSDRFTRNTAIGASMGLTLVGFLVLLVVSTPIGLAVGLGLLGIGISWPGPVQARFFDIMSQTERGYGYGLVRTVYMLIGATSSVIVGVLVDLRGWVTGIESLVVVLTVGLVLIGFNWVQDRGL